MGTMSTGRKVFHCAVDDTVLTTNISEIKKWTSNGAITLFVPLYSRLVKSDDFTVAVANKHVCFSLQPSNASERRSAADLSWPSTPVKPFVFSTA